MTTEKWQWAELTRRAVEGKARAAQRARDLDVELRRMKAQLDTAHKELETLSQQAQDVIAQRDMQLEWLKAVAIRWQRGSLGAMDAIAAIYADFGGFSVPEANDIERQRAIRNAEVRSLWKDA